MSKKGRNAHKTYILCLQKVKMGVYFTMLNDVNEFDSRGWFRLKKNPFLILVVILLAVSLAATAEDAGFKPGDWAFNHAPEEPVLSLREDGAGTFYGLPCRWEDDGAFLRLTAENGTEFSLRYRMTDDRMMVWLPAEYVRAEGDAHEGVAGSWKGKNGSGNTFIFREEDNMFLEDGTFTGSFKVDPEAGTIRLVYIGGFDDALLYFSQEGNGDLKIEYPWTLVKTEQTP